MTIIWENIILLFHHRNTFKCHVSLDQTPQIECNIFHTVISFEIDLEKISETVLYHAYNKWL